MKKNYKLLLGFFAIFYGFFSSNADAQIAAWQFNNLSTTTAETAVNVSLADAYLQVNPLSLGAGLDPILIGGTAFGSKPKVTTTADLSGITTAIANNDYYGFSLSAKTGYQVSLDNFVVKIRFSSGRFLLLRYSLDGTNFTDAAPAAALTGSTGGNGAVQPTIDLSGITALQNVAAGTTVYFRLYYSGSNNTSGTTAIGRSLTATEYALSVTGDVTPTTAPQSILAWQFASPATAGNEASINATTVQTGLTMSILVRGAGLRNTSNVGADILYPGAFVANSVTASTASASTDIADAITNNMYFAFQVKPSSNYKVSLATLRAKVRASVGGAKTWLWRYSTDNVNFTDIGTAYYNPGTSNGGVYMPELDLTGIAALQNINPSTTIYFRLYLQGSNATTGSSGLGISPNANGYVLSLNGTVESTLPVKLTAFKGTNVGKSIRLNWRTASETNNHYFDVLRLAEGKLPLLLASVNGNGNSSTDQLYSYTDQHPQSGTNYYQLRQVDFNGNFELSEVIAVNSLSSDAELLTFFKGETLNVVVDVVQSGTAQFKILDMSGRNLYSKKVTLLAGKSELQVPVSLQKGTYIVSLTGDNHLNVSQKIIK